MTNRFNQHRTAKLAAVFGWMALVSTSPGQSIPKTWDEAALASMQTPLLDPTRTPKHMSSDVYNRIPLLPYYKTYPVYAAGREPAGYLKRLRQVEPEIISNPTGEAVFDAPTLFANPDQGLVNPQSFAAAGVPVAADGTYPFVRYVIRKQGELELGGNSCAWCHIRVMPDGSIVKGAQGNFPLDRVKAESLRALAKKGAAAATIEQIVTPMITRFYHLLYAAPWIKPDPYERVAKLSVEELVDALSQVPAGVSSRDGSTFDSRPQIPDLIGIRDRRYLNHTGTHLHRSVGDLMRYATLAQGTESVSSWGDFRLVEAPTPFVVRFTDEALYALANYIYALKPPANPNHVDAQSRAGSVVFEREGCGSCHTAPLYTNNRLMPAGEIGTDPELAMLSRRGTGYYKVPSLKGVWYRGPFGHNGSSPTLEDWLDATRVTGRGTRKPSPGHEYGLHLTSREKSDLIAFLRTL